MAIADASIIARNDLFGQSPGNVKRAIPLIDVKKKLLSPEVIKAKPVAKLIIAGKEMVFHKKEQDKGMVKLMSANKELEIENAANAKRAAKLAITNKKLLFQIRQGKMRAGQLANAHQDLVVKLEQQSYQAEELREAIKELESFSYSVSHDLRAPLRAINGYTQVLAEDYLKQLDEDAMDLLNQVILNSKRMSELIDNLLEFSRFGKQHLSIGTVDMNHLVMMVIAEQKN